MTQLILTQANYLQKPIAAMVALLAILTGKITDKVKSVAKSYWVAKAAAADAAILHNMSTRELNDIGISRCDINRLCYAQHADKTLKIVASDNENLVGSV